MCSTFVGRLGRAALACFLAVGFLRAEDYTCTDTGAGLVITGYSGGGGEVTIPSMIGGVPVVGIGDFAFLDCANVTNLIIPDSVARIGYEAFEYCSGLTNVTLGSGIASIGRNAFFGCGNIGHVTFRGIPETIEDWEGMARSMSSVFDSPAYEVEIAEGVTRIRKCAFMNCGGMTAVTVPAGVTNIGDCAFEFCTALAEVSVPEGVSEMGEFCFGQCSGLRSVTVPDSVVRVGPYAFYECAGLEDVTLGSGIASIGRNAFFGCGNIGHVTFRGIPETIEDWEGMALSMSSVFDSPAYEVEIAEGVTRIRKCAFEDCGGMTAVTIPSGVADIGDMAFAGCRALAAVTVPAGVTNIGDCAFEFCTALLRVAIPASVARVGVGAFSLCRQLMAIEVAESNTHFASLDGVLMNKEMTSLIQWPGGKEGLFTVPASVSQIADYAFANDVGPVSLYFKGDAPSVGENTFNIDGLWIYYASTSVGWGDALGGYRTTLWNPQVLSGSIGVTEDGFGFVISNAGSPVVVVEACTNLSGASWDPVSTNVLSGGSSGFRDSEWRSHASRFYRFRMP